MTTLIILLLLVILAAALWLWRLWFAMTHPENHTDCGLGGKKHLSKMHPEVAKRLAAAVRKGILFGVKKDRRL